MIIPIRDFEATGYNADNSDVILPPNVLTFLSNMVPFETKLEAARPVGQAFTTPTYTPYGLFPVIVGTVAYWVSMGTAKALAFDGTSEHDITRTVGGDYTGAVTNQWTGGVFAGVLVVTNGVDDPQQWDGVSSNPTVDLLNWPANTTCKVIRPFSNWLMAGGVSKSGTSYPYMVKWGSSAEAGAVPSTWDPTDNTQDAGEHTLYETGGAVVDFHPLGSYNYVYKQGSIIEQRPIGGDFVFAWDRTVTDQVGVFSTDCVTNIKLSNGRIVSVVFGTNDCVMHDGRSVTTILNKRWRRTLYNAIDVTNYQNCRVINDITRNQVLFLYPTSGSTWCNQALIWNYADGGLGIMDFLGASQIKYGLYDPNQSTTTYDSLSAQTYDGFAQQYDDTAGFNPTLRSILFTAPSDGKIYEYNNVGGLARDGLETTHVAQRVDWAFVLDRYGKVVKNVTDKKLIRHVHPRITGSLGTGETLAFRFGGRDSENEDITWGPYLPFDPRTDRKVDVWQSWRYIAWELNYSGTNVGWALEALDFDIELTGRFW